MRKKKTHRNKKDHVAPSAVLLAAHLQSGAGKHAETKTKSNSRTGRLSGAEKRSMLREFGLIYH